MKLVFLLIISILLTVTGCKSNAPKKPCDRSKARTTNVSTNNHYDIDCQNKIKINQILEV